jgi:putative peptide zinc metalloprotease protein
MMGMPDISTVELSRTRLKLREDLLFVPQNYNGETFYHLEVKTTSEYFRVGYAEYVFVSLLDGRTGFAEALAVASQQLKEKALGQTQAISIYSWLLENGLGAFADSDTTSSGASTTVRTPGAHKPFWKKLNPLWQKIPFGRPDALLRSLQPVLGWIFSGPATILAMMLMVVAGLTLSANWERFTASSANVVSQQNWLWLLMAWIALKFFHEIGHALVCHRYGGNIRETGLVIAFFAPLAYVDASSCWSFRSRWQRIHTALAGVYVELIIASLSILAWKWCDSVVLRHVLQNTIIMASVSTLLFNLNPLMKFDGYYVLSDLLQIPNLSTQANSVITDLARRVFFGDSGSRPTVIGRQRWVLMTYGAAAMVWRLLVTLSLLIMASVLFHGAGLALAAVGVVLWFGRPLWGFLRSLNHLRVQHPERLFRASLVSSGLMGVLFAALFGLPSPVMTTAPGVVDFTDGEVVRAETPGFIEAIHVKNGQVVNAGDLLLTLRNEDVTTKLLDLQKQLAQQELRVQTASGEHNLGALNVFQGTRESLLRQLHECQKQKDGLEIRAGRSGQVISRDLHNLSGTFASAGMELMTIGVEEDKELKLSIGQRDLSIAAGLVGQSVKVRIGTHDAVRATLVRVNPRASRSIPHPSLAATNGGPLAVSQMDERESASSKDRLRLTEHRFTAVVELPDEQATAFRCGERGTAALGLPRGSLGTHLWRSAHDWLDAQLASVDTRNRE